MERTYWSDRSNGRRFTWKLSRIMETWNVSITKDKDLIPTMIELWVPVDSDGMPKQRYTVYITNSDGLYNVKRHKNKRN